MLHFFLGMSEKAGPPHVFDFDYIDGDAAAAFDNDRVTRTPSGRCLFTKDARIVMSRYVCYGELTGTRFLYVNPATLQLKIVSSLGTHQGKEIWGVPNTTFPVSGLIKDSVLKFIAGLPAKKEGHDPLEPIYPPLTGAVLDD